MNRAFAVGDRVCLSVIGLCEVHNLDQGRAAPLHTGEVTAIGLIHDDDVLVTFDDDQALQCGPDWLLLLVTKDGDPWHTI